MVNVKSIEVILHVAVIFYMMQKSNIVKWYFNIYKLNVWHRKWNKKFWEKQTLKQCCVTRFANQNKPMSQIQHKLLKMHFCSGLMFANYTLKHSILLDHSPNAFNIRCRFLCSDAVRLNVKVHALVNANVCST